MYYKEVLMDVKISSKGWLVIPADLRRKYRLQPGTRVTVVDYGGVLSLVPIDDDPIASSAGTLRGRTSLTQAIVEEHRAEVAGSRKKRPRGDTA